MSFRRFRPHLPSYPDSLLLAFVLVLLDQNIKLLVRAFVAPTPPTQLGTTGLALVNVGNSGGWLVPGVSGYTTFAFAGLFLAIIAVVACWRLGPAMGRAGVWGAGLLLGGVFSNLLDRLYAGQVLDMFAITVGRMCRVTNLADGAIFLSVPLFGVALWRFFRNPDPFGTDETAPSPVVKPPRR